MLLKIMIQTGAMFVYSIVVLYSYYRAFVQPPDMEYLLLCIVNSLWILLFTIVLTIILNVGTNLTVEAKRAANLINKALDNNKCHPAIRKLVLGL